MLPKPAIGDACNGCGLCCQITVCGVGSYVQGLVERYGDRANGPCPLLIPKGDGFTCGLVARPKDHIASDKGVTPLRNAVAVMIGAGAGCDEVGDEPDATALPKIHALQNRYIAQIGVEKIQAAARLVTGGRKNG